MKLKICGLRPGDDLSFTGSEAVDYMGIIFVPASQRYVAPEDAAHWLRADRPHCDVMGVFVDSDIDDILAIAEGASLNGIQLHGNEDAAVCRQAKEAGYTVWKSLTVQPGATPASLLTMVQGYADTADGLLLDAAPPKHAKAGMTGGHGVSFDWTLMAEFLKQYKTSGLIPELWVAGGFRPDNVAAFVGACRLDGLPVGIDVSSGVEENGRKSLTKIEQMIQVVNGR